MADDISNVVGMRSGQAFAVPGNPDPAVVAALEDILKKAKDGEINGILISIGWPEGTSTARFVGVISRSMVGSAFAALNRASITLDDS